MDDSTTKAVFYPDKGQVYLRIAVLTKRFGNGDLCTEIKNLDICGLSKNVEEVLRKLISYD